MFEKLRKILPDLKNVKIIETNIDPEVHLEYIEYSSALKEKGFDEDEIKKNCDKIFLPETKLETKKQLITQLASIDEVEIFRKLEKYNKNPDPELSEWAKIAYQESLATIQSSLLGQEQIVISTGLGGKNQKIRFFVILKAANVDIFNDFQKRVIEKELNFALNNNNCELEKLEFGDYFFSFTALFPLDINAIENPMKSFIEEVKSFGIILSDKYIFTNVKIVPIEECGDLLNEMEQKEKASDDELDDDFDDFDDDDFFGEDFFDDDDDDDDDIF
jgi:hypothetical protein